MIIRLLMVEGERHYPNLTFTVSHITHLNINGPKKDIGDFLEACKKVLTKDIIDKFNKETK